MPQEEVEAVIRLLQSRADTDITLALLPKEAKLLVDYINQLRIMATRLHEAGMACVAKAFEFGPPPVNPQPFDGSDAEQAVHEVAAPLVAMIGSPGTWAAQAVTVLTRHVEAGG